MRRGAQTIKQSGMDANGGGVVFSKRERVRKLSGVGGISSSKENCEMGFVGSDGEDELQPTTSISKRFKLPKKFFDDCNTVDHASVPRRLRSAMKKRNYESISPPLPDKKQPNHVISGGELPKKDSRKKSKSKQRRQSEGSPSQTTEAPITKDEEEAAETLNTLAVMFPFPNNKKKNDSGCELENAKSLLLPEAESSRPLFEATEKEDDSKTLCPSTTPEAANPSLLERSALENVQVKCSKNGSDTELDDTISQRNVQAMCSKQPKYEELQPTLKERENSEGSPLWPGLFSAGSHDSRTRVSSVRSSIGKTPCSLGMDASLDRPDLLDDGVLTDKDFLDPVARKKSWKRCSAHIYICHLIKDLEIAKINDRSFVPPTQLTPNEGSKQGVFSAANALNTVQNGFHGAVEKNTREVRDAILLHRRLLQDHQQGSTTSALYNPTQKQCFDFLSPSAGGGVVEAMSSVDKVGKVVEPLTQFHIPYLHSLAQNQSILPFSIPQIRFSSTPFTDNPIATSKQVQIPPPPPHLSPPPHLCPSASPKLEQQQQQQQWIWTTQYQPMGIATTHFPNWQNGRQDPFGTHYAQSILSPSHSSLEVLGPKYAPISQHQQLIAVTSSLPTAKAKRQHHHHLPSGYEGNGVGSCPDTALPLQLLCNEHL